MAMSRIFPPFVEFENSSSLPKEPAIGPKHGKGKFHPRTGHEDPEGE
jgi:hypothetical protein